MAYDASLDYPVEATLSIARPDKAVAIQEAQWRSGIDGFGSEGEGWDYDQFAAELEERGWVWTKNDSQKVSWPGK